MSVTQFVWRHLLPKKGTQQRRLRWYTREIPYYTDASFSAFAWKTNLTNHTKSLNDTCVPLFTVMSERYSIPKYGVIIC